MTFFSLEANRGSTLSLRIKFLGSRTAGGDEVSEDDVMAIEELLPRVVTNYPKAHTIIFDLTKRNVWESLNQFNFDWESFCNTIFQNLTCFVSLELRGNGFVHDQSWDALLNHIATSSSEISKRLRSLKLINIGHAPLTFRRIASFSSLEELCVTYSTARKTSMSASTCTLLGNSLLSLPQLRKVKFVRFLFDERRTSSTENGYFPIVKALGTISTLEHVEWTLYIMKGTVDGRFKLATLTEDEEELINFFPRLNKAGYCSMLANGGVSNISKWINVVFNVRDHFDCLYYLLRTSDPTAFAKAALNESQEARQSIEDKSGQLALCLNRKRAYQAQ